MASQISIIIPVLNEERQLAAALALLRPLAAEAEVMLVDGGSADGTVALAHAAVWPRVVQFGRASRALQMNAGAAAARGETLLFLHADVSLPANALAAIRQALSDERVVGGCFSFGFPPELGRAFRLYAWGVNLRTRWFRTATGDQAIFARRAVFERLGGYRDTPLMEDIELFKALKAAGNVAILPQRALVSPRRWQQHGLARTGLLMYALRLGYWLGIAPERLKRFFSDVR